MPYKVHTPRWKRQRSAPARINAGRELSVDRFLLAIILGLTLFGAVMVYSASAIVGERTFGSQFHFVLRQGMWGAIGLLAMVFGLSLDYRRYKNSATIYSLLGVTIFFLIAVFALPRVNETHRWMRWGLFSLQPSELAKPALVAFLAFFLERRADELRNFKRAFLPAALVGMLIIGLVALEPDLGTALALGVVFVMVMFEAGTKLIYLAGLLVPVIPAVTVMLLVPWRFQRLLTFLDPWKYATTWGFQSVQSMIAIGSGGTSGLGFAQGKQKLFFLPSPQTDFIFAVIGEELGLAGALTLVGVFAFLAFRGFKAARYAPDVFGRLLAVGLTVMIVAQAFFNISVTLSLVPTKGIPLPFISAGGTSLAISLFAAGVLLNISKHEKA
ncbi:MAG TPA: putative lipid II flippase FtsW [Blastocatellia bacterium]|nr:putative lipid II flippase FtsW [Blastocatellia bacterium]